MLRLQGVNTIIHNVLLAEVLGMITCSCLSAFVVFFFEKWIAFVVLSVGQLESPCLTRSLGSGNYVRMCCRS